MKKIALSGLLIIVFLAYVLHQNDENAQVHVGIPTGSPQNVQVTSVPAGDSTPAASGSSPVPTTSSAAVSKYKDGAYTSAVGDAFYGPLQIKVTISGGKITDVAFLQYPNDRSTSVEINSQAMPILKQETITAQSAQIDGASGASQTSSTYVQLLQDVLTKASS